MYFFFDKNLNKICLFDDLGEPIEEVIVDYDDQNKVYFFSGLAELGESTYVSDKYELINYLDNSNFLNFYKAEGSFSAILLWNNEIKFINDCIQRESFFYYHHEINSFVSNSFLLLTSECKKKNISLTFNEEAAKYQLIEHYFFDQLFSRESLTKEISNLIPPQIITSNKNSLSIVKNRGSFLIDESLGNQELLQNSVQSMAQDLLFSSQSYKKVITNLTGGQDSRIIFGVIQTQKSFQNNNLHLIVQ